jgi:hypothetical protein
MFLGAFAKLRKATISFVMSVCPSVRPLETTRPPTNGLQRYLSIFRNSKEKIQVLLHSDKNNEYFT